MPHMVEAGLPAEVRDELSIDYSRVQTKNSPSALWHRHLTCEQKSRLGNDLAVAYRDGGTVGMWMRLNGVSAARAVIDVAKYST